MYSLAIKQDNKTVQKKKTPTKNLDSFENVLIVLDCPDKLKRR